MTYIDNNNGEIAQTVEPAGNSLRWLWWLLGLLVLAGLIWALVHACTRNEEVVTTPAATNPAVAAAVNYENIWTTRAEADVTDLRNHISEIKPELATALENDETRLTDGARHLCAAILNGESHAATDVARWFDIDHLEGVGSIDDDIASRLSGVVQNASWCHA